MSMKVIISSSLGRSQNLMKPHSPSLQRSPGCILWPALPETDLDWTGLLNWDTIKEVDNLLLVGKARQWLPTLSSAGAGKELSLTVTAPSALSILVINIRMKVHFQNYIWSINQSWTLMVKKYKKSSSLALLHSASLWFFCSRLQPDDGEWLSSISNREPDKWHVSLRCGDICRRKFFLFIIHAAPHFQHKCQRYHVRNRFIVMDTWRAPFTFS